jgi:hypothetical protein
MNWRQRHGAKVLEKLIVTQPVKKFSAFYGIQRLITVFTRIRHWIEHSAS